MSSSEHSETDTSLSEIEENYFLPDDDVRPKDEIVQNVAVLVWGREVMWNAEHGSVKVLLTRRAWKTDNRQLFDIPGGSREEKSILETAKFELYEETAKYPLFHPEKTEDWLRASLVYYSKSTKTLILIANITDLGEPISGLAGKIYDNFPQRIDDRERERNRFTEKDGWRTVRMSSIVDFCNTRRKKNFLMRLGKFDKIPFVDYVARSFSEISSQTHFDLASNWF